MLNGNNSLVALTRSLSVQPGDVVNVNVFAKYEKVTGPSRALDGFTAALTSAFNVAVALPAMKARHLLL